MKRGKRIFFVFLLALFLFSVQSFSLESWIKGPLPEIKGVISSVIAKYFSYCTPKEAKEALDSLGADKKDALINFLGKEGKDYLISHTQPEHHPFIKSFNPEREVSESEFQKLYPEILPVLLNRLAIDKYNKFIPSTDAEIISEAIFMDWMGMEVFWKNLEFKRHEIILDHTPDWVYLEIGLRKYAQIKDYTAIFYKQERLDGELQGVEKIVLKYREKPKGIYMKWIDGPWKGRELVYNEKLSKDKIRVRESGLLGVIPVWVNYRSPIAMRGTNHPVLEVGLKFMLDLNLREYKKAFANNELARKNHGIKEVDGHRVYAMEMIMTRNNPQAKYYCHRVIEYMDYERALEPKVEVFNWNDELQESFLYTQLKLNVGLKDIDFDPKNPDYRL